jgi:hypothetical protein
MKNHVTSLALLVPLALAHVACGDSDDKSSDGAEGGVSDAAVASFEGLYELDAYTENPSACDTPGPSTFEAKTDRLFVMVGASAFGQKYLQLASCDEASCASTVAAIRQQGIFSPEYFLILSSEVGPDELGGFSAGTGFEMDGVCTEREYETHELTRTGDAVHIESRSIPLSDAPVEDGFCVVRPAEQREEAAGRPCGALVTFDGAKIGPLP